MMAFQDSRAEAKTIGVGLLLSHRWLEAPLAEALTHAGLRVVHYADAVAFASGLLAGAVDIALVEDHERQFMDSMTTLRFRGTTQAPILAIGRGTADDIRSALQYGAADYVVQGEAMEFMVNRVLARLAASQQGPGSSVLRVGDCWLEASSRSLHYPNGETQLTPREFALAWVLFEQAGEVVNMHALSQKAWGRDASIAKRTIEQHVSRLRAKLLVACACSDKQINLHAVHNIGYRLVVNRLAPLRDGIAYGFEPNAVEGTRGWVGERRRSQMNVATA